jgi:hypothetical protein
MMSRKMRQARPNGFVEYKGHTRHLSAEPVAVILSEAKDLALSAQGKLREESRPGLLRAVFPTQIKVPRFARNDIAWFLSARPPTGMNHCYLNVTPKRKAAYSLN